MGKLPGRALKLICLLMQGELRYAYQVAKAWLKGRPFDAYHDYASLKEDQYPKELTLWYYMTTGRKLDLENPQTFNDKSQWLKLYDCTPLKTQLADKYLVRDWVKERIGEECLVPLLGVWNSFDQINFDLLPDRFVLKANHGSGWNIVVRDKAAFDKAAARRQFAAWMSTNYAFAYGFELHYANIPRKIIAERYIENADGNLYDYKIHCFNGKPQYVQVIGDRDLIKHTGREAFYDTQWNLMPFTYNYPRYEKPIPRPGALGRLLELTGILCRGFAYARIDLYVLDEGIKFGEITFIPSSGTDRWNPPETDLMLGQMVTLPPRKWPPVSSVASGTGQ